MPSPLDKALERLQALKAEVVEIERFIAMYKTFSVTEGDNTLVSVGHVSEEVSGTAQLERNKPVENSHALSDWVIARPDTRRRNATPPREIVDLVERMILETDRPMTRGEILEALEARDVDITVEDKARYIGTIMWRNKAKFVNIEGRGYWVRGRPLPPLRRGLEFPREQDMDRYEAILTKIHNYHANPGLNISDNEFEDLLITKTLIEDRNPDRF